MRSRGERRAGSEAILRTRLDGDPAFRDLLDRCQRVHAALQSVDDGGPAVPTVPPPPRVGERIGTFRLLRRLGGGGMGLVFLAEHAEPPPRRVALKILPYPLILSEGSLLRFRREAEALARLRHPHVVPIHAFGTTGVFPYIAMEYVDGIPLKRLADFLRSTTGDVASLRDAIARARAIEGRRRREPAGRIRANPVRSCWYFAALYEIGAAVAEALDEAHRSGIVHRDVKPSNIIVDADGRPFLVDFGLALDLEATALTRPGEVLATPCYAAPEQLLGGPGAVDGRADIYGLGATLFDMASPEGLPRTAALRDRMRGGPPRLRAHNPAAPRDLEAIVAKALEWRPAMRHATAAAMAGELRAAGRGGRIRTRRLTVPVRWARRLRRQPARTAAAIAAGVLVAAVLLLAVHAYRSRRALVALQYEQALAAGLGRLRRLGRYPWSGAREADDVAPFFRRAASLRPGAAAPWFYAALVHERSGGDRAAWEALNRCLAIAPDHRAALLLRARCAERLAKGAARAAMMGRAREDRARLRAAGRLRSMGAWLDGREAAERGNWARAIEAYDGSLEALRDEEEPFPGFRHEVHLARAMACIGLGRFEAALEECAHAESPCPDSAAPALLRAYIRYVQGRVEEAERILAEILEKDPESWREVLQTWAWLGDWPRTRAFAKRANALRPWDRRATFVRAMYDWGPDLLRELHLAARLHGDSPWVPALLGGQLVVYDGGEARRILEAGVRRFPDAAPPRASLGRFFEKTGRIEEAVRLYREALRLEDGPEIWMRLGDCLLELGRYDEAGEAFRRASAGTGGVGLYLGAQAAAIAAGGRRRDAARLLLDYLRGYIARGYHPDYAAIIADGLDAPCDAMDDLVRRHPHPHSFRVRSEVYGRLGRRDALLRRLATEIAAGPRPDLAYGERGNQRLADGRLQEAARDFEAAVRIRPSRAAAWVALAASRDRLGRAEASREARWEACRRVPEPSPAFLWTRDLDVPLAFARMERWAREVCPDGPAWRAVDALLDLRTDPRHRVAYWDGRATERPGHPWILHCLARACEDAGWRERAEALYAELARRDPALEAWFDVFRLRAAREPPAETAAFFRAEAAREPRDWTAWFCAGDALVAAGGPAEALEAYARVFDPGRHAFPEPRLWHALDARLARLPLAERVAFWHRMAARYADDPVVRRAVLEAEADEVGPRAVRINAGGLDHIDALGNLWSRDRAFLSGAPAPHYLDRPRTRPGDALHATRRVATPETGDLRYAIPVPEGTYRVVLHCMEVRVLWRPPAPQIFGLHVGGAGPERVIDLPDEAGLERPIALTFAARIRGGPLRIRLRPILGAAKVSAIEIIPEEEAGGAAIREKVRALLAAGGMPRALARLREGIGRYPDLAPCLGGRLVARRAYEEALPILRMASRREPCNVRVAANLAECLWALGRDGEAEAVADRARGLGPEAIAPLRTARWRAAAWRASHGGPPIDARAAAWRARSGGRRDVEDLLWLIERGFADREPIRIHCGGPDAMDGEGRRWSEDRFCEVGHGRRLHGGARRGAGVPYDAWRWRFFSEPFLAYAMPLPDGRYTVTLHFPEDPRAAGRANAATFRTFVNGRPFPDPFGRREGETGPVAISTEVAVEGGVLEIRFAWQTEGPTVAGIEVARGP